MKDIKPADIDTVTGGTPKLLPPLDTTYLSEITDSEPVIPGVLTPIDYTPPDPPAR